jgi:UDPglucose 6-dehydrogenase
VRISVVGLGKLGAPLAAVLASRGFTVIGVDVNSRTVTAINAARAPVDEPGLQELLDANRARLTATDDMTVAIAGSDVTFVIVPTPSERTGRFGNEYVLTALAAIGAALRRKSGYHLVVITSTVMPGSTGGELREALEQHAGRAVGASLGLCYNPEFIALGSVVRDMLRPDLILIGESDTRAGDTLAAIYATSCENRPAIKRMNFVNAELTKIAINTFVTTKISYANMLADMCDRLPGADVDLVTDAVGADSRVGTKYLRGAIGYGGPCFPRDNVAFAVLARSLGANPDLAESTDRLNDYQNERLLGILHARMEGRGPVGILGLSYKPDTTVIEASQGVALADRLLGQGYAVIGYDPKAMNAANLVLRGRLRAAATAEACVRASDAVVVMTPWPAFRTIDAGAFARPGRPMTVIDCWRILPADAVRARANLVYLGHGARTLVSDRV